MKGNYFDRFGPWMSNVVLPAYKELLQEGVATENADASQRKEEGYTLVANLLEKVEVNPEKVNKHSVFLVIKTLNLHLSI